MNAHSPVLMRIEPKLRDLRRSRQWPSFLKPEANPDPGGSQETLPPSRKHSEIGSKHGSSLNMPRNIPTLNGKN